MFPVIQLGPLAIQSAGLFLLASIWIGMTLTEKRAAHSGLKSDSLDSLILLSLFGLLAGGRLAYAALHFDSLRASPLDIFSLNTSLFDLTGGLAAGFIVALVYGQRKGLAFWPTLDALTPFFATMMVGLGASHLASGDAFGKETSLPWGIELFGAVRLDGGRASLPRSLPRGQHAHLRRPAAGTDLCMDRSRGRVGWGGEVTIWDGCQRASIDQIQ